MTDLAPVLVGFLLTTVAGGGLGYFFQNRSWHHQHDVQRRESERERAEQAFEEVSRLLDKRLYRLRQLYWSLRPDADDARKEAAATKMDDYRAILYEWNDSINRNLAVIQQYFGLEMRDRFDYVVGRELVELGAIVEAMWKERDLVGQPRTSRDIGNRLAKLAGMIYEFNLALLRALQSGSVGVYLPGPSEERRRVA